MNHVYHYTTLTALQGILDSSELHASRYSNLNDAKELVFLAGMIKAAMVRAHALNPSSAIQEWLDRDPSQTFIEQLEQDPAYIISFTTEGDALSQWRGYGGGVAGGGCAIEFDRAVLAQQVHAIDGASLSEVTYIQADQAGADAFLASEWMSWARDAARLDSGGKFDSPIEVMIRETSSRVWNMSANIKHAGFAEEKETRIIAYSRMQSPGSPPVETRHRWGPRGLTPYLAIPINLAGGLITRIHLGPGSGQLQEQLEEWVSVNYAGLAIKITSSATPFR